MRLNKPKVIKKLIFVCAGIAFICIGFLNWSKTSFKFPTQVVNDPLAENITMPSILLILIGIALVSYIFLNDR